MTEVEDKVQQKYEWRIRFWPVLFQKYVASLPPETEEERNDPLHNAPRTVDQLIAQFAYVVKGAWEVEPEIFDNHCCSLVLGRDFLNIELIESEPADRSPTTPLQKKNEK